MSIKRVIVMVQENHTTDNYFRALAPYGANVATGWPVQANPPASDQPHDRHAYYGWLTGQHTATRTQFDTEKVLPFYEYLALTGAFLENHCSGFGTNSTPNHLLIVGGQTPTLRNPSRTQPPPLWDMPSVPGLAQDAGIGWACYTGNSNYPVGFYKQLNGSKNLIPNSHFVADAAAGKLPPLTYLWHNSPEDEHPTADVTIGMNKIWESVDAVVKSGGWDETVFLLTWDDWGGWDDHVATPNVEHTPDGVQLAYGPRVPLLMFGGPVKAGIDSRWSTHAGIPKTVMQLLGLPKLGVDRVDNDPGLSDLVDSSLHNPPPPAYGTKVTLPAPPQPAPKPQPLPAPSAATSIPVGPVILRGGGTLPPPNDVPLKTGKP
ncbi:alkaline phosphatase family protein [Arthrobacter sp. H14-L1]|uniref:alkaline phosphatase family protein n=1 Tax=Arthrobacter sp. H14-L1 TaxID=2996697 RepID=UPI00226F752E|nr:alkaline phosphatase family protein [Arthrobacter sp. H14-L1]MCY0906201.1 hypothetical protein [Arthrobacter sp. H14-L1]